MSPIAAAGASPKAAGGLGAAAGFAVLADTALTCTNSTVTGPVGVASSSTAVTQTGCMLPVQVAPGAYTDFLNAYTGIAGNLTPCVVLTGTLAGVTLGPGTYCFDAAATLTGTLTLTGTGPWLFEIGTGGTGALTATNFTVVGSNPCNATWSGNFVARWGEIDPFSILARLGRFRRLDRPPPRVRCRLLLRRAFPPRLDSKSERSILRPGGREPP